MLSSILSLFLLLNSFHLSVTVKHHIVKVRVSVPEDARAVAVTIYNDDYLRSSQVPMDSGRLTYWVDWRDVPSGEFEVVGQAVNGAGKVASCPVVRLYVE